MEIRIISTTENKLLDRKEVEAEISFAGPTPKRSDLREITAKKFGADPDCLVLRKVTGEFGRKVVMVSAHLYNDIKTLKTIEPSYMQKRLGIDVKEKKKTKVKAVKEKKA